MLASNTFNHCSLHGLIFDIIRIRNVRGSARVFFLLGRNMDTHRTMQVAMTLRDILYDIVEAIKMRLAGQFYVLGDIMEQRIWELS